MRRIWRQVLGLDDRVVLEAVEFDEHAQVVVARVRPRARWTRRCGRCGRRSPGYDRGVKGRRILSCGVRRIMSVVPECHAGRWVSPPWVDRVRSLSRYDGPLMVMISA